jgi:Ca2+-binding RTX toxin-like protein
VLCESLPARADAFGTFANGVLTVSGGEGKIVPRCAGDGEITVSGVSVDNGPAYCRDLRRIEASSSISTLFDFSQLPDDNDRLSGGADSDKVDGGRGNDVLFGGAAADKLLGGPGRDTLKGGGGSDKLIGGPGRDTEKQ